MAERFLYDLDEVDFITVGTVGQPGSRAFLLQAGQAGLLLTLLMEKEQAAALAAGLARLLSLLRREDPEHAAELSAAAGSLALVEPFETLFRIGRIGLGVDESRHRVIVLLHELDLAEPEEDAEAEDLEAEDGGGQRIRLALRYDRALGLSQHIPGVVSKGRPNCPACGEPMDAEGHRCQRRNGHH